MNRRDLTVVLTLKDRSNFTYRWMDWMQLQKFPYKILIADGGKDQEIEKHLKNHHNYPNLDYDYLRYPYDNSTSMFVDKLSNAASKVTTEFVIIADNDDLILLSALEENLKIMRDQKDIHSVAPATFRFKIHRNTKLADDLLSIGNSDVSLTRIDKVSNPNLQNTDPISRMTEVIENFYSAYIYYGIHKSDDFKRIYIGMSKRGIQRFIFIEWFALYSYAVAGKILLDCTKPFLLRQDGTSQAAVPTYSLENHSSVFLLPDWSAQLYGMIEELYLWSVEMNSGIDRETFERVFLQSFREHMLSWMQFRGIADRLRRLSGLYTVGRKFFRMYRGYKNPTVTRPQLEANEPLRQALSFMKQYQLPQSAILEGTR